MKISPPLYLSMALAAVTFVSSVFCLLAQPDLAVFSLVWQVSLLALTVLLPLSFLRSGQDRKNLRIVLADVLFLLLVFLLNFTGILNQDLVLEMQGLGASFSYNLIYPSLVMLSSILAIKDAINILYGYGAKGREVLVFTAIRLSALCAILILGGILFLIISKGIGAISWEFLTEPHRRLGQSGGISTAIEGTFWLILGAMLVSAPLGIGAAIYMNEYSKHSGLKRSITIAISVLNGVPSVVFGLFGLAFLVTTFGVSLLSGSVILGLMNIPTIILTTQESLKSVPNSLREGSLALGATKWQTTRKVVVPASLPGILTGLIIGLARAAGETAPIMWTAVTFTATPVSRIYGVIPDVFQPVNNLGYHLLNLIYFLGAWDVETNAWGTALVLLALVLGTNMLAIVVRNHYRKKISW
jgi:phosphate transport system permease protein